MAIAVETTKLTIGSTAFVSNGFIPEKYTCDGQNINPPIAIKNIPSGTKSLAVIVEDPDAPGGTFVHWIIWNLKPQETIFEESSANGIEGKNSFGYKKYDGPCPPSGTHHYHFKVYALDTLLSLKAGASKSDLLNNMKDHILGEGEIIGKYERQKK